MKALGNLAEDQVIDFKFSTYGTNRAPITLAGTPSVSVYKANDTTQSTAGVTLTVGFDSLTGCHHVRIDTSADAFYAVGNDYQVVITAGTVDSISVVGTVLAEFSIENRFMEADAVKIGGTTQTGVDFGASRAQPGRGTPAASQTFLGKVDDLHKAWRNKSTQTSTDYKLFNDDATTVDHKATCSNDGTTFTRGEVATGP